MNKTGFKKLSISEQRKTFGGFGWAVMIGIAVPLIINAITQALTAYKMLGASKGSIKYQGYESHWEETNSTNKKKDSHKLETRTIVYAY